jgi:N-acetylglucosaminyldiphosphoundecaprenol N-acetyl-beta-D-mannosaminyltransferase
MNNASHLHTNVAPPIVLLGVPFDSVTTVQTVGLIEQMVASRQPHHLVTANVDFLVQALHDVELHRILTDAHMVLCDGMPLVWASRLLGNRLPERVAGSDLVPLLIRVAAEQKYRIFFLGGSPESTEKAVENLRVKYPELIIAGYYSPPFAPLLEMDHDEICRRVREAKPDLLFVSFGCPKQEKWIAMHYRSLGVPVAVGVGATIDFLAGTAKRAPRWMQQTGLEWTYRLAQEPRRLVGRYARDLAVFSRAIIEQWRRLQFTRGAAPESRQIAATPGVPRNNWKRVRMPARMDGETVRRHGALCEDVTLVDLSHVKFIDSTGVALLMRLQKRAREQGRKFALVAPSKPVKSALRLMRLLDFFIVAADTKAAEKLLDENLSPETVRVQPNYFPWRPSIFWQGEITARNAEQVWRSTAHHLASLASMGKILIDISALRFIDSTGVGLMLRAKKDALRQGLEIVFTGIRPNVRNVLRLAKAENILLDGAP